MKHFLYILIGLASIGLIALIGFGIGTVLASSVTFLVENFKIIFICLLIPVVLTIAYVIGHDIGYRIKEERGGR